MNKEEKALGYFRNKFNCSQSVFTVFGLENGLTEDECLKIGCGFGAGIGRQQFTCGAVTGAVMALGLKFGKATGDPEEKKSDTYNKVRELFDEFTKINGSTECRRLLCELDINDPYDQKITDAGLFESLCEKYVTTAVKITEDIIERSHN